MIGIPILDSLSYDDLVRVVNGDLRIRVPIESPLQTSIDSNPEPTLSMPIEEMDDLKIVTLCGMEIESRDGWAWLAQKIRKEENDLNY